MDSPYHTSALDVDLFIALVGTVEMQAVPFQSVSNYIAHVLKDEIQLSQTPRVVVVTRNPAQAPHRGFEHTVEWRIDSEFIERTLEAFRVKGIQGRLQTGQQLAAQRRQIVRAPLVAADQSPMHFHNSLSQNRRMKISRMFRFCTASRARSAS